MGLYSNAHLIYGVLLTTHVTDEETYETRSTHTLFDVEEDSDSRDVEDFVAEQRGETYPWKALPYEIAQGGQVEFDQWVSEHPEWIALKERWYEVTREIRDSAPVEIQTHGHYEADEQPTFLVLKGCEYLADAWVPESIDPGDLSIITEKVAEARAYCKDNELPSFDDPRWYLVASYG